MTCNPAAHTVKKCRGQCPECDHPIDRPIVNYAPQCECAKGSHAYSRHENHWCSECGCVWYESFLYRVSVVTKPGVEQ